MLQAAGRHGGALPLTPDRECPRAGQWLESKFQPWAPRVLEHWLDGDYDHFDAVMFSRADDSSQRLYYYLGEMQRTGQVGGPEPLIFDVAKIPRQSSLVHIADKLRALADQLSVDRDSLEAAIRQGNSALDGRAPVASGPVCLVAGSPPPDTRLFDAVEQSGFAPVGQTLEQSWLASAAPVEEGSDDPLAALAKALHVQDSGPRSFADPAERLCRQIADSGARAVVIWHIEEDETRTWQLPSERAVLEQSGLPFLVLSRRDWLAQDGAADEIAEFLEGVSA
ncbi:2-hydroxyacyl-CoA dehydratase family protein [Aurantiacibacter gilvus]|uniref:2-hydroxyacyl-CoA dehydratase family protein n=1 Tax=Aurantiacibacter gilvus TaxID=3139141 RepID=A0ABU9IFY3_9SPHN